MTNYEKIRLAIQNKCQVHATYDGYRRLMCPHLLGYSKKGELMGLFYQFGGGTSKGPLLAPSWKCMRIYQLSNVEIIPGDWYTDNTKGKTTPGIVQVNVRVHL